MSSIHLSTSVHVTDSISLLGTRKLIHSNVLRLHDRSVLIVILRTLISCFCFCCINNDTRPLARSSRFIRCFGSFSGNGLRTGMHTLTWFSYNSTSITVCRCQSPRRRPVGVGETNLFQPLIALFLSSTSQTSPPTYTYILPLSSGPSYRRR